MTVDEWIRSVNLSFRTKKNPYNGRDIRVELLRGCEIQGECWVAASPVVSLGTKKVAPRQLAYAAFCGPIPRGTADAVRSRCGNPRCCYPGHLILANGAVKQSRMREKSKGCDDPRRAN